jgi:hypothetical protein
MLGELVSNGALRVSNLKRSSSPYYYLEEHKDKLQELSSFLNDKDKLAYDRIKHQKILRDSEQSPLIRVALRAIRDFAIPLQINHNGNFLLFWKWYMVSKEETSERIKTILGIKKPEPEKKVEPQLETKPEKQEKLDDKEEIQQKIVKDDIKKEEVIKKAIKKKDEPKEESSPFIDQLKKYFDKNNIKVNEQEIKNRTKTEIDFIIELPSAFGNLQYYCKAKNKKKINDSDIASAMIQGQLKKLPVLLIITGDITKKSQEMLENEYKGVKVHKI